MPKNIEDIIPSNRRSIRDIPIPATRKKGSESTHTAHTTHTHKEKTEHIPIHVSDTSLPRVSEYTEYQTRHHKKGGKKRLWMSVGIAALILVFAVMSLFGSATLAYTPKSADLTFEHDTFTAHKSGDGSLLFSVVKLSGEKGVAVAASGEEDVSVKASGTIVVYNTTATPQKLIATTRFATPDGKEYRIPQAITIPAKGSIETVVNADKPGAEYNIGMSDFTVPGLKGDARFSSIYARSKTAMSGGFVGKRKKVDQAALSTAKAGLESQLKTELMQQAESQVPEDFILFGTLSNISFDELAETNATDNGVTVNERGNFYGVMFKKSDFARYIASKKTEIGASEVVTLPDVENIVLNFSGTAPADLLKADTITFEATGLTKLVWVTDESALKGDLAGVKKGEVPAILKNYTGVQSANAVLRPFWKTEFPKDPSKIKIKEREA